MLKHRLARLFWIFIEKFGLVLLSVVSFFVYALVLTPEQLGLGVIILGAVELITLLNTSTFDSAFTRLDKITSRQDGSLFWGGISIALLCALGINLMTLWYSGDPDVGMLMLIASLILPLQMASRVHVAHMRRDGNFKALAKRTLAGKLLGMLAGISAAYAGWGPWAIILQAVIMQSVATTVLLCTERRPLPYQVDWRFIRELAVIGIPVAIKAMSWNLMNRGVILVLGMTAGAAAVGYFNLANRLIELPRTAIFSGLMSYALPVFARRQRDLTALREFYYQATQLSLIVLAPLFVGLALMAEDVLVLIFADKWLASVVILQVLAVVASIGFVFLYTSSLLVALKQQAITLRAEITGTLLALLVVFVLGQQLGAVAGAIGMCIRLAFIVPVNSWALNKVLDLSVSQSVQLIKPSLLGCIAMTGLVLWLQQLSQQPSWLNLVLMSCFGAFVYAVTYTLVHMRWVADLKSFLKNS